MRDLSSSVLGRRYASLTTAVIAGLLLSVFTFGGQAGAWVTPTLTANCAPDASHYAWTVNLHPEGNQRIEMSWGTGAFTTFQTTDFGSAGAHTFTTPRVATTLSIRYASDKNVKTSALANGQICSPGTTNGGTVTGDRPSGPNGNNGDVKIHESATAVQDHRNQPHVCTFYIDAFNFDKASNGIWRIEQWAPTGSGVVATGSWGPADNDGNWHSASMTLADGHYKLFFKQTGTPGGEKQKVFWVECGKTAGERAKGNENENDDQDTDSHTGGPTSGTGGGGTVVTTPTTNTNGGTGSTGGSTPAGNAVAGFETAPNAVGSVTPIVDVVGGSTQRSPNGTVAGVQASPVAGVQSLPSTSTDRTPTVPLAALGLAIMALGGVLLRRRDLER